MSSELPLYTVRRPEPPAQKDQPGDLVPRTSSLLQPGKHVCRKPTAPPSSIVRRQLNSFVYVSLCNWIPLGEGALLIWAASNGRCLIADALARGLLDWRSVEVNANFLEVKTARGHL